MFSSLSSTTSARRPSREIVFGSFTKSSSFRAFSASPILNGIVMITVVPVPSLLSIRIVPPILSASFFAMGSPSPVPSYFDRLVSFSWVKRSNACATNSWLIPGPLSAQPNSYTTRFSSANFSLHHTWILPPGSVNFTALSEIAFRSRSK